jgi:hypothetical protein
MDAQDRRRVTLALAKAEDATPEKLTATHRGELRRICRTDQ